MEPQMQDKLIEVLQNLGSETIPYLNVDDFNEILDQEPESESDYEVWEENLGLQLTIKIIDLVFSRCVEKFDARAKVLLTTRAENSKLRADVAQLQAEKKQLVRRRKEETSLEVKNKERGEDDQHCENTKKRKSSECEERSRISPIKKSKCEGEPRISPIRGRRKHTLLQPQVAPKPEEVVYVEETLPVQQEVRLFPGSAGLIRSIPDTPEKRDKVQERQEAEKSPIQEPILLPPSSPVIGTTGGRSRGKQKLVSQRNAETDREMFNKKSLKSQESPEPVILEENNAKEVETRRVGKIAPSVQCEIDRRVYENLVADFSKTHPRTKKAVARPQLKPEPTETSRQPLEPKEEPTNKCRSPLKPKIDPTNIPRKSLQLEAKLSNPSKSPLKVEAKNISGQPIPPRKEISKNSSRSPKKPEVEATDISRSPVKNKVDATNTSKSPLKREESVTLLQIPRTKPETITVPSESDNDFESPNLLLAKRPMKRASKITRKESKEKLKNKAKEPIEDVEDVTNPSEGLREIDVKDENVEDPFTSPIKKQNSTNKGIKKAVNRWGMEVDETTESQKKRNRNQKQSKIDGFFKNPPSSKEGSEKSKFKRVNHADTDMERAIQLSKETLKNVMLKVDVEMDEEDDEEEQNQDPAFAFVGPVVRGRDERKKLLGFDCRECQEYYQSKLEEGYTKDQILAMLNKCSRHRGLFKPPLTPEKFWDPHIVEDDTQDPRNKTQAGCLRNRAQIKADARKKRAEMENWKNT